MSNQAKKEAPKLSKTQVEKLSSLQTVSDRIRYLHKEGMSKADISRALNKRYQHVRNVLIEDARKAS